MTTKLAKIKQYLWNTNPVFFNSISSVLKLSSNDIKTLHKEQEKQRENPHHSRTSPIKTLNLGLVRGKLALRNFFGKNPTFQISQSEIEVIELEVLDQNYLFSSSQFEECHQTGELSAILNGTHIAVRPRTVTEGIDRTFLIRNATLIGGSGLVFQGRRAFWGQAQFVENRNSLYPNDPILIAHDSSQVVVGFNPSLRSPAHRIKRGISLLDSAGNSFGHFVLGAIPKLRGLRTPKAQKLWPVLIDDTWPKQFKKLIADLVPESEIIEIARGSIVSVDELLFPQQLKHFPDHIKPGTAHGFEARAFNIPEFSFLFGKTKSASKLNHRKGVFLFRNGTQESDRRQIVNIATVIDLLGSKGFQDISANYADLSSLRKELQEATHIVTDDGSISFNLFLAGITGKKVLFFSGPDFGGYQEWGLPGYLTFFGNDVTVLSGKCKLPENQFKPWWIELSDLKFVFEEAGWTEAKQAQLSKLKPHPTVF
jgi:hypothetical protein